MKSDRGRLTATLSRDCWRWTDEEKAALKAELAKVRAPVRVAQDRQGHPLGPGARAVSPETYVIDAIARLLPRSAVPLLHPLVKKMLLKATTAEPPAPSRASPR